MRHDVKSLKLSVEGAVTLCASEGVVPAVYEDSVGVDTYGVGVTAGAIGKAEMKTLPVVMPEDIHRAVDLILDLFVKVVVTYESIVKKYVKVPLTQYEYDALVHFVYNIGEGNFAKSKLLKYLNTGNYETAGKKGFHGWLQPRSLKSRRDLESTLFLENDYGNSRVPVYKTDGNKNLAGIVLTLARQKVIEMLLDTSSLKRTGDNSKTEIVKEVPPEVVDLIEEVDGEGSKTNLFNTILQQLTSAGIPVASVIAFLQDVDPIVIAALIAAGVAVYIVSTYTKASRNKKAVLAERARQAVIKVLEQ